MVRYLLEHGDVPKKWRRQKQPHFWMTLDDLLGEENNRPFARWHCSDWSSRSGELWAIGYPRQGMCFASAANSAWKPNPQGLIDEVQPKWWEKRRPSEEHSKRYCMCCECLIHVVRAHIRLLPLDCFRHLPFIATAGLGAVTQRMGTSWTLRKWRRHLHVSAASPLVRKVTIYSSHMATCWSNKFRPLRVSASSIAVRIRTPQILLLESGYFRPVPAVDNLTVQIKYLWVALNLSWMREARFW